MLPCGPDVRYRAQALAREKSSFLLPEGRDQGARRARLLSATIADTMMRAILIARLCRPRDALSVVVFSVGSLHEPIAWLQGRIPLAHPSFATLTIVTTAVGNR